MAGRFSCTCVCLCVWGEGAGILIFSLYQDTTVLMDYPSLPSMPQERCHYANTKVCVCGEGEPRLLDCGACVKSY